MRISDWSSDVCSSDLAGGGGVQRFLEIDPCLALAVAFLAHDHRLAPDADHGLLRRAGGAGNADQVVELPARGLRRLGLGGIDEARARLAVGAGADHGELVRLDRLAGERAFDAGAGLGNLAQRVDRSEEHTSELQSLLRISYAVFCVTKKNTQIQSA